MRFLHGLLSRTKRALLRNVPQRRYWNLMGYYDPIRAVCSEARNEGDLYTSGEQPVSVMERLGLLGESKRTLHIGCGIGRVERSIAGRVKFAIGIDISERMAKIARRKVSADNVSFLVNSGRDLQSICDQSIDLCYSFIAFQHMPREVVASYFVEVRRILKADGAFFFQIPVDRPPGIEEPPANHPYALRYYAPEEVMQLLEKAGLSLVGRYNSDGAPYSGAAPGEGQFFLARVLGRSGQND